MAEIFISLQDAAELEGIEYNTLVVRLQRDSFYKTIKKPDEENGGRERVCIAVSSLSPKARAVYRKKQTVDISELTNLGDGTNAPWYVYTDWGWFKERYSKAYNEALEMARHVQDCITYDGKDKTEYIAEYASDLGISAGTLYRKIKSYAEASAWALEMTKNDNKNYEFLKILALCREPKKPQGSKVLTEEMKALIENIWFDSTFAANLSKYAKLYRYFCEKAPGKGWDVENLPSYDTVCRYIKSLRKTTDNARVLVQKGEREFKRTVMVKRRRDLKQLKVMELVVADTHTFDCFVMVTDSNGKKRIVKPCLVGFMDMRSRALVGWGICEMPNSQIIKEVMISMIMEKTNPANPFHGVPRVLLIDNGKDYTSVQLTGRSRKQRMAQVTLEQDALGFFPEIGIERDMRSLPYCAWVKGEIERYFGTVCEDFTKDFISYVGTLTGSKTSAKIDKDIYKMFLRGELIDIDEFAQRFEHWLLTIYSKRAHKGLKSQNEVFTTPLDVYLNEERYFKPAPPVEYLQRAKMVRIERKVYTTGIKLFGCDYMDERLNPYINGKQKLIVRYDPDDVSTIHVYDPDTDRAICKAANVQLLNPLAPVGDKDLEEHIRNQKRQVRDMHPRGQGTIDIIVASYAGSAGSELLAKVEAACIDIKGPYDNLLIKSAETVAADVELVLYLPYSVSVPGIEDEAAEYTRDYFKLNKDRMLNSFYVSELTYNIRKNIDVLKGIRVVSPVSDMVLEKSKVIILGEVKATIERV